MFTDTIAGTNLAEKKAKEKDLIKEIAGKRFKVADISEAARKLVQISYGLSKMPPIFSSNEGREDWNFTIEIGQGQRANFSLITESDGRLHVYPNVKSSDDVGFMRALQLLEKIGIRFGESSTDKTEARSILVPEKFIKPVFLKERIEVTEDKTEGEDGDEDGRELGEEDERLAAK